MGCHIVLCRGRHGSISFFLSLSLRENRCTDSNCRRLIATQLSSLVCHNVTLVDGSLRKKWIIVPLKFHTRIVDSVLRSCLYWPLNITVLSPAHQRSVKYMLFPLWERSGLGRGREATVVSLKVPLNATNSFSVWVVTQSLSPWMARSVALSSSRIWSVYFLSPHLSGKNPNSCLSFYNSPCNLVLFLDESGNSVQPSFALLICHKYISWINRTDGFPPPSWMSKQCSLHPM